MSLWTEFRFHRTSLIVPPPQLPNIRLHSSYRFLTFSKTPLHQYKDYPHCHQPSSVKMSCIEKFNWLPRLDSFLCLDLYTGVQFSSLLMVPLWLIYSVEYFIFKGFESASELEGWDLGKLSFLDNINDLLMNPSRRYPACDRWSSRDCQQDSTLLCHQQLQQQEHVGHRWQLLPRADHRSLPHCRRNP